MSEQNDATRIAEIRQRIERLRKVAITSPVDESILDLIEELAAVV